MGDEIHHNEWQDGSVIVRHPQTRQCRQVERALTAHAFLLEQAQDRGGFDYCEVADLERVTIVPDPLRLGRVEGSEVDVFITQWDTDVNISDILQADQGWIRPDGGR
jgi:hypothetical protein